MNMANCPATSCNKTVDRKKCAREKRAVPFGQKDRWHNIDLCLTQNFCDRERLSMFITVSIRTFDNWKKQIKLHEISQCALNKRKMQNKYARVSLIPTDKPARLICCPLRTCVCLWRTFHWWYPRYAASDAPKKKTCLTQKIAHHYQHFPANSTYHGHLQTKQTGLWSIGNSYAQTADIFAASLFAEKIWCMRNEWPYNDIPIVGRCHRSKKPKRTCHGLKEMSLLDNPRQTIEIQSWGSGKKIRRSTDRRIFSESVRGKIILNFITRTW